MRKGILITRGAIIERGPREAPWSLALPLETSVLEVVALMSEFRLYCEMEEGAAELRLLPLHLKAPPTGEDLVRFYQQVPLETLLRQPIRFMGVDYAAGESVHVGPR